MADLTLRPAAYKPPAGTPISVGGESFLSARYTPPEPCPIHGRPRTARGEFVIRAHAEWVRRHDAVVTLQEEYRDAQAAAARAQRVLEAEVEREAESGKSGSTSSRLAAKLNDLRNAADPALWTARIDAAMRRSIQAGDAYRATLGGSAEMLMNELRPDAEAALARVNEARAALRAAEQEHRAVWDRVAAIASKDRGLNMLVIPPDYDELPLVAEHMFRQRDAQLGLIRDARGIRRPTESDAEPVA